jgi:hypothetical protein
MTTHNDIKPISYLKANSVNISQELKEDGEACKKLFNKETVMQKFEYKMVDTRDVESAGIFKGRQREDIEAYLNEFGQQGWELVNVDFRELEGGVEFAGIMKRALR